MQLALVKSPYFLFAIFLCLQVLLQPVLAETDTQPSSGRSLDFFQSRGSHSLDGLFGVPSPLPAILPTNQLTLSLGHSNMFASGVGGDTLVVMDGERSRLALSWTHVWSGCLRTGVELPVIAHAGGYFDSAIEGWHEIFNLPNANREETPADTLTIAYRDPSGESLLLDSGVAEHGDLTVSVLWSLGCKATVPVGTTETPVLRFGLKLPTGRLSTLTGSGEADVFMDITSKTRHWNAWSGRAAMGVLLPGQSNTFSIQEDVAAFGTLALAWQVTPVFQPIVQIDWHTAMFDTTIRELGRFTAQATVGFQWRHANGLFSEYALLEDIVPDASPDIGLHVALRYAY